jgi:uncharacterized protein YggE
MKQIIAFLIIISWMPISAQMGEKNFIDQNYIEVTGKAEMEIVPDMIYLDIIVSEKDSKNKTSLAEMEKVMIGKLKELEIDVSKDLSIKDVSSIFKRNIISKSDVLLSKEYVLLIHNGTTAGKVVGALEQVDISNISIEKVDHSKIEQYRKEVKINATKAAKEKAELLSNAVNQAIGKALFIQEVEQNLFQMPMSNRFLAMNKAVDSVIENQEPSLNFEKIRLEYSVLVRFELK